MNKREAEEAGKGNTQRRQNKIVNGEWSITRKATSMKTEENKEGEEKGIPNGTLGNAIGNANMKWDKK